MSFDAHKNFAYSTVATAPSPASSGTSLVVQAGDGAKFPAAPFNATVWPAGVQPSSSNAEIVRVTAKSTDTFTITRAQESSSARSIGIGDQIAATITAKTLTDIEATAAGSGTAFPGSPADGDLFYRTDRRIMYEYDATSTHWLSLDRKYATFTVGRFLNATGSTGVFGWFPIFEDIYLESFNLVGHLGGVNNGSNFWTITVNKNAASEAATSVTSVSTASDTASNETTHSVSVAAVIASASYKSLSLVVSVTGSPSGPDLGCCLVLRSVG